MKTLLILGAGTAGTLTANRLRKRLREWKIAVVDEDPTRYYQPGFLFLPFGIFSQTDVVKPRRHSIANGVDYLCAEVDRVQAEKNRVLLRSGEHLNYDVLIIATGVKIAPEQTEGMLGCGWRVCVFDFYTFEGASALHRALRNWNTGRLVVHITQMPIKCSVAPLEFAFLADSWLKDRRLRDKTEIVYVTPLSAVFSKPVAAKVFGRVIEEKRIKVVTDFPLGRVDNNRHKIISCDGKEIDYDLLVTVPTNAGDVAMGRSGLANELNFVATDNHTLQSKQHSNIFVLGDATDLPWPKSSSVAQFQSELLTENVLHHIKGEPLESQFDGHADRFINSGDGKAFPPGFDERLESVDKKYRFPVLGPFSPQAHFDHFRELAFRWIYGTCSTEVLRCRELCLGLSELRETAFPS
ncbi:MAG TPA: FAD/NAD(P)-binding oxidoreductase [Candidatus Udaeobacter sp.]|jgi:sulfide:quinone oxidoreductase